MLPSSKFLQLFTASFCTPWLPSFFWILSRYWQWRRSLYFFLARDLRPFSPFLNALVWRLCMRAFHKDERQRDSVAIFHFCEWGQAASLALQRLQNLFTWSETPGLRELNLLLGVVVVASFKNLAIKKLLLWKSKNFCCISPPDFKALPGLPGYFPEFRGMSRTSGTSKLHLRILFWLSESLCCLCQISDFTPGLIEILLSSCFLEREATWRLLRPRPPPSYSALKDKVALLSPSLISSPGICKLSRKCSTFGRRVTL